MKESKTGKYAVLFEGELAAKLVSLAKARGWTVQQLVRGIVHDAITPAMPQVQPNQPQ